MKKELLNLIEYNFWGNKRCIESLNNSTNIDKKAEDLFSHLIAAQLIWLTRINGKDFKLTSPFHTFNKEEFNELNKLTFQEWLNYLNNIEEKKLVESITYINFKGEKFSNSVYDIIMHVSHHSAYHRGQIASLVRAGGGTPAVTDYIAYKRE